MDKEKLFFRFSPILASKISISTNRGVNVVANAIAEVISKNGNNSIQKNVKNHEEEYFSKVRSQIFVASSSYFMFTWYGISLMSLSSVPQENLLTNNVSIFLLLNFIV